MQLVVSLEQVVALIQLVMEQLVVLLAKMAQMAASITWQDMVAAVVVVVTPKQAHLVVILVVMQPKQVHLVVKSIMVVVLTPKQAFLVVILVVAVPRQVLAAAPVLHVVARLVTVVASLRAQVKVAR